MISANPMASSTPGMANARSCIMEPIAPFWSAKYKTMSHHQDMEWRGFTLINHFL